MKSSRLRLGIYLAVIAHLGIFAVVKNSLNSPTSNVNPKGLYIDESERPSYSLRVDTKNFKVLFGIGEKNELINFEVHPIGAHETFVMSHFEPIKLRNPSLLRTGDTIYLSSKKDDEFVPYILVKEEIVVLSNEPSKGRTYHLHEFLPNT